jgi:hypothetical protein
MLLTLFLAGCLSQESMYKQVQEECPRRCEIRNSKWTGLLKAFPDLLMCVCDKDLKGDIE